MVVAHHQSPECLLASESHSQSPLPSHEEAHLDAEKSDGGSQSGSVRIVVRRRTKGHSGNNDSEVERVDSGSDLSEESSSEHSEKRLSSGDGHD